MFACSVFYCSLLILYFICIFLLLLPTWRIKLMMMMMISTTQTVIEQRTVMHNVISSSCSYDERSRCVCQHRSSGGNNRTTVYRLSLCPALFPIHRVYRCHRHSRKSYPAHKQCIYINDEQQLDNNALESR